MIIGVPKEIKNHEYRVGMTPAGVQELTARGHKVLVQQQGGEAIGLSDAEYQAAGAELVASAAEIFARAEMIVKVKEPQPEECELLRPGQLLFTYLHLAPDPVQTQLLVHSGAVAIAYETVTDDRGGLPLITPTYKRQAGNVVILFLCDHENRAKLYLRQFYLISYFDHLINVMCKRGYSIWHQKLHLD